LRYGEHLYRTLSYLSLAVGEITVLDLRFFGGIDFEAE